MEFEQKTNVSKFTRGENENPTSCGFARNFARNLRKTGDMFLVSYLRLDVALLT